jgi:hypothetical protein
MHVFLVNFAELVFLPAFVGLTKHMHSLAHTANSKKKNRVGGSAFAIFYSAANKRGW